MINVVLSAGTICFVQFGEYRMAEQRDAPFCSAGQNMEQKDASTA